MQEIRQNQTWEVRPKAAKDARRARVMNVLGGRVELLCLDHDYLTDLARNRFRRVVGKRLVVADGKIVTAYHAPKPYQRRLLRSAQETAACIWCCPTERPAFRSSRHSSCR